MEPGDDLRVTPRRSRGDLPARLRFRWVRSDYLPGEDGIDAADAAGLATAGLDALIGARVRHVRRWHDGGSREDVVEHLTLELQVAGRAPGTWYAVGRADALQRRTSRVTGETRNVQPGCDDATQLRLVADDLFRRACTLHAHAMNLDGLAGRVRGTVLRADSE